MKKLLICAALALATTACSQQSSNHQAIAWDSMTYSTRTAVAIDHGFMRMGK